MRRSCRRGMTEGRGRDTPVAAGRCSPEFGAEGHGREIDLEGGNCGRGEIQRCWREGYGTKIPSLLRPPFPLVFLLFYFILFFIFFFLNFYLPFPSTRGALNPCSCFLLLVSFLSLFYFLRPELRVVLDIASSFRVRET